MPDKIGLYAVFYLHSVLESVKGIQSLRGVICVWGKVQSTRLQAN